MRTPADFTPEDRLAASNLNGMAREEVDGLKALYQLYHRSLLSLIHAITGDPGAAEEILQDVFVRAYRDARKYDPELGAPFVWLATIARRMAYDWLRKKQRRPHFVDFQMEHPEAAADIALSDDGRNVQQQFEAGLILEYLRELPAEEGKAVELAFLHGHTHHEISQLLGKPLGTVKSSLRRGLIRLRKFYLGEDD